MVTRAPPGCRSCSACGRGATQCPADAARRAAQGPAARADALQRAGPGRAVPADDAARAIGGAVALNGAVRLIDASSAHRVDWLDGWPGELLPGHDRNIALGARQQPGCYPTAAVSTGCTRWSMPAGCPDDAAVCPSTRCRATRDKGAPGSTDTKDPMPPRHRRSSCTDWPCATSTCPEIRQHARLRRAAVRPGYGHYRQGIADGAAASPPAGRRPMRRDCMPRLVRPLCRIAPPCTWRRSRPAPAPSAAGPAGAERHRHGCDLLACASGEHIVLAAVLDNLNKGAAGAAVRHWPAEPQRCGLL